MGWDLNKVSHKMPKGTIKGKGKQKPDGNQVDTTQEHAKIKEAQNLLKQEMQNLESQLASRLEDQKEEDQATSAESPSGEKKEIENIKKELAQVKKKQEEAKCILAGMDEKLKAVSDKVDVFSDGLTEKICSTMSKAAYDNMETLHRAVKKDIVTHQVNTAQEHAKFKEEQNLLKQDMKNLEAQLAESKSCLEDQDQRIKAMEQLWKKEKEEHDQSWREELAEVAKLKDIVTKLEIGVEDLRKNTAWTPQFLPSIPNEFQLRERKKNNLIIFGLPENTTDQNSSQESPMDNLFQDLCIGNSSHYPCFRVGNFSSERYRPLVVRLPNAVIKNDILIKAKMLKGNEKWRGVSITHDLTKVQCAEEKTKELLLRQEAVKKNECLSPEDKMTKIWKVVGGRGSRALALRPLASN